MRKPIIIGVDTRDLRIATTGTKTYLEELCLQFRRMEGPEFRFFFFDTAIQVYSGKNRFWKLLEHARFQFWKQVALPIKAWNKRCDILFCTDFFVPLIQLGYRTVPVFHDAFFFEYPGHYNKAWLFLFRKLAVTAARRSPALITPSLYAKERVQHYTGIDAGRIHSIYEAPKSFNGTMQDHDPLTREMLAGKTAGLQYILHIGSYDKRKNLPVLIKAFQRLVTNGYGRLRLVLVGRSSPKLHTDATAEVVNAIAQYGMQDHVTRAGYLPDEALPLVYKNSFLYVFPSVNEGFGLPVVESFHFGLPVIVANNTSLPEIGGPAVLSFDPWQADDVYEKMKMVIDNEALRENMIQKGKERLSLFSWEKAANELGDIFKKVTANNI